ncbi:hypothetical protein D0859_07577 [Hortaea werneckii]|uniref:Uncharacterized protein n=1 Tax=Hortaea werneckii TaxID=91943 RepID=A0A3M7IS59_HORWE|nr:hypothetical protein D0859_07577 [Hortaea werneckii]
MVAISEVKSANASLENSPQQLTAVFTGATNGTDTSPTHAPIIIERNQTNFTHELDNLHSLNPNGTYTFLETDISLIRTIDHLTPTIQTHLNGTQIDLLIISQDYISLLRPRTQRRRRPGYLHLFTLLRADLPHSEPPALHVLARTSA